MSKRILLIAAGVVMLWVEQMAGQDTIPKEKVPTLIRIAEEYDNWRVIFGISIVVLSILSFFGLRTLLKVKVSEWLDEQIAKKAGLKIEHLNNALSEYAQVASLKKRCIMVISKSEGQQANVKRIFDNCGFSAIEWKSIRTLSQLVLDNTDLILFNDQHDQPLSQEQIENVLDKFKDNVAYLYFGPNNRLPIGDYRNKYPKLNLGLCNSPDRLETGLISLLKII